MGVLFRGGKTILTPRTKGRSLLAPKRGVSMPGRGSGVKGGALLPPSQDSLVYWYDFGDTSTMYRDTGKINPVTSTGHAIALIESKGTTALDLTAPSGQEPTWQTSEFSDGGASFVDSSNDLLNATMSTSPFSGGFSAAAVWVASLGSATRIVCNLGTSDLRIQFNSDETITVLVSNVSFNGTTAASFLEKCAAWGTDDGANTENARQNQDAQFDETSGTSDTVDDDEEVTIGALNRADTSNNFDYHIAEVMWWNDELDASERTSLETYISTKYGITWA